MKRSLLLLLMSVSFAACADSSSVDCRRLAAHEFALTIKAMPEPMQARATDQLQAEKRAMQRRCESESPTSAEAKCALTATDLAALRRCQPASAE
jgi:hypothetical protein